MIKNCIYKEQEVEIRFEWPLSNEVIENTKEIQDFMERISSIPGTIIMREEDGVVGLVLSYEGWTQLLSPYHYGGRNIQLLEEFGTFFDKVRPA